MLYSLADQIQSGVEEYPNQVYKVPVHRGSLHTPMLLGGVHTFAGIIPNDEEEDESSQDVECMHPCHHVKHASHRT